MKGTYKQPSLVSGMSVQDVLNMDNRAFNQLTKSELRQVTGRLVSAANKRLKTFEKTGTVSPALSQVRASGGKFSTRGKDLNALRAEYARARNFMTAKTGTVKQYNKVMRQTVESLAEKGIYTTKERAGHVFSLYDRLKEMDPSIEERGLKYKIVAEIEKRMESTSDEDLDDALNSMRERIAELYEESEEDGTFGGVSDFFDI